MSKLLPRDFERAASSGRGDDLGHQKRWSLDDISTGEWRPVSEWEVLCKRDGLVFSDDRRRIRVRALMSQSICHLAKKQRQILYNIPSGKLECVDLFLAVASATARGSSDPPVFEYLHPRAAVKASHPSISGQAWLEAAIHISVNAVQNSVLVASLNRDLATPSYVVDEVSPRSKTTVVMTCFALAMAAEIIASLQLDLGQSTLSLLAVDRDHGKLERYYEREYGLKKERSGLMEGSLVEALESCDTVWLSKCDPGPCKKSSSFLSRRIDTLSQMLGKLHLHDTSSQAGERAREREKKRKVVATEATRKERRLSNVQ